MQKKMKTVQVKSEYFANEQIIVIFKKIDPKQGPVRAISNNYFFNELGITEMLERDAILFWKEQKKLNPKAEIEISFEETIYDFEKVKDTYEIEKAGLDTSQPI